MCFETLQVLFIFDRGEYSLPPPTGLKLSQSIHQLLCRAIVLSNQNLICLSRTYSDWLKDSTQRIIHTYRQSNENKYLKSCDLFRPRNTLILQSDWLYVYTQRITRTYTHTSCGFIRCQFILSTSNQSTFYLSISLYIREKHRSDNIVYFCNIVLVSFIHRKRQTHAEKE